MTNSECNYNSLDLDHKKEFLMNQSALLIATHNLALELKCDSTKLIQKLWETAYETIKDLSDAEVHRLVSELEAKHQPFDQPGGIITN